MHQAKVKQGMLLTALTIAEKRRWVNFETGDESWLMRVNPATRAWTAIDEELLQRMLQRAKATRSMNQCRRSSST
jgi:hypothetical protein